MEYLVTSLNHWIPFSQFPHLQPIHKHSGCNVNTTNTMKLRGPLEVLGHLEQVMSCRVIQGKTWKIWKHFEKNGTQWNIKLIMMIIITIMIVRQRSHCISRILGWTPGKTSQKSPLTTKNVCSPWHRITCISKTGQLEPAIYGFFSAIIVDHWRIFKRF